MPAPGRRLRHADLHAAVAGGRLRTQPRVAGSWRSELGREHQPAAGLERAACLHRLETATARSPSTALLGPRQCASERGAVVFDLESEPDVRRLSNPELVLGDLDGLVVLDEVQRLPQQRVAGAWTTTAWPGATDSSARSWSATSPNWASRFPPRPCGVSGPMLAHWHGQTVIEQVLAALGRPEAWFWAAHGGGELDLLVIERGRRIGFEVKFREAPKVTRTTRTVAETLALDHLFVVCPTRAAYPVDDRITVLPVQEVTDLRARIAVPVIDAPIHLGATRESGRRIALEADTRDAQLLRGPLALLASGPERAGATRAVATARVSRWRPARGAAPRAPAGSPAGRWCPGSAVSTRRA